MLGAVRKKRRLFPPLACFLLLLLLLGLSSCWANAEERRVTVPRLKRIQKHLEKINKPPTLTIQSPDGDFIDCIHKRRQPALDHPLLRNHKIQLPPEFPRSSASTAKPCDKMNNDGGRCAWQAWHANGTRCPKGTVPVRRTTVDDVLRAKSQYDYGRKQQRRTQSPSPSLAPDMVRGNGHEHAIAYTGSTSEVYGAKATINVWEPWIEQGNEFSLSQIWILSGSFDDSDLNSIEAGWQVSPELYGDTRPRVILTKPQDVTISYAQGLFRQPAGLPLGQPFPLSLHFPATNLTSPSSYGRTQNWGTGGWALGITSWWATGHRSCSPTCPTTPRWWSSAARSSTQGPRTGPTRQPKWARAGSPGTGSGMRVISGTSRSWTPTIASARSRPYRPSPRTPTVTTSGARTMMNGARTFSMAGQGRILSAHDF